MQPTYSQPKVVVKWFLMKRRVIKLLRAVNRIYYILIGGNDKILRSVQFENTVNNNLWTDDGLRMNVSTEHRMVPCQAKVEFWWWTTWRVITTAALTTCQGRFDKLPVYSSAVFDYESIRVISTHAQIWRVITQEQENAQCGACLESYSEDVADCR